MKILKTIVGVFVVLILLKIALGVFGVAAGIVGVILSVIVSLAVKFGAIALVVYIIYMLVKSIRGK